MFNKNNFCHIASNNRNEKKAGVFVYKTTDDLATVLTSGYFNDKIVDINLHDLIIHEWHDQADRTKVQRNIQTAKHSTQKSPTQHKGPDSTTQEPAPFILKNINLMFFSDFV